MGAEATRWPVDSKVSAADLGVPAPRLDARIGAGPESSKNGLDDPCHPPVRFSHLLGASDPLADREGNWDQARRSRDVSGAQNIDTSSVLI